MRREQKWEAVICLMAGLAAMQPATGSVIKQINNHFDVSLGVEHLNYQEISPAATPTIQGGTLPAGAVLDSEVGNLFSPQLSLSLQRKLWIVDNIRAELNLHMAFGNATYNGYLQDLNTGKIVSAVKSSSGETFTTMQFKIGKGFSLVGQEYDLFTPYLGYGLNAWHRAIGEDSPYGGYSEQYRNRFYVAGLQYQFALGEKWVLKADGNYGRTQSPKMNPSDLPDTFNLMSAAVHNYEFGVTHIVSSSAYIGLDSYWTRYSYVLSQESGGFVEPTSKTGRYGIQTVFGYSF